MAQFSKRLPFSYLYQFRSSAFFVFLSLLSGACNYLYYPLMSRILSIEDFGASQALIAILSQAGSLFAGLSLLTIYLVQRVDANKITNIIGIVQKTIVAILIILTLVLILLHSHIAAFLNLRDNMNLFIVVLDLLLSVPFVMTFGFLLAKKRFIAASLLQITVVVIKLIVGGLLAYKFGIAGALLGFGLSFTVGMALFWSICKMSQIASWEHSVTRSYRLPSLKELRLIKPYFLPITSILIVSACTVIFPTLDVVIARHYLDSSDSSLYAAASTLSSILLFACLPVANILIPLLNPKSIQKSLPHIKKALYFIAFTATISLLSFIFLPDIALSLFGQQYTAIANILWIFGLNMLFVCLIIVSTQILVLYRPLPTVAICLFTILLFIITTQIIHGSAKDIITSVMIIYATILILAIVPTIYLLFSKEKNHAK